MRYTTLASLGRCLTPLRPISAPDLYSKEYLSDKKLYPTLIITSYFWVYDYKQRSIEQNRLYLQILVRKKAPHGNVYANLNCCGKPKVSVSDIDRWTDNITRVLDSPRARKKFNDFLSSRTLDDALTSLQFWESCNKLLLEANHDEQLKKARDIDQNIVSHARFNKHYTKLVELAEDSINLDAHQLRVFRHAASSQNVPNMIKTLRDVQHSVGNLMLDEFNLFRDVLLKEAKSMKKK